MKQVWLVRHGESKSQSEESDDCVNPPLSTKGIRQAKALSAILSGYRFDIAYVSPLNRAYDTYRLSGVKATRVVVTSLLIEHNWGIPDFYTGLPNQEVAPGDTHGVWQIDGTRRARILIDLLIDEEAKNIICFAHWGIFSLLLSAFIKAEMNLELWKAEMDNTAFSKLSIQEDGKVVINCWNSLDFIK